MPSTEDEAQTRRWWLLRWGPRHDSGVVYAPDHDGEVWVSAFHDVVPFLVESGDFAPADMQYRMHREHLWDANSGLYGERFNVDAGAWVEPAPTPLGNARAALGMARALTTGGEGTPPEMRARWQRETAALVDAIGALGITPGSEAAIALAEARRLAAEDGWLHTPKV